MPSETCFCHPLLLYHSTVQAVLMEPGMGLKQNPETLERLAKQHSKTFIIHGVAMVRLHVGVVPRSQKFVCLMWKVPYAFKYCSSICHSLCSTVIKPL